MTILGLDTGLATCGLAVVEVRPDGSTHLVTSDVFTSEKSSRKLAVLAADDLGRRDRELAAWLATAFVDHRPGAVCIEAPSWPRNAGAAAKMGSAFGVVFALAFDYGNLPVVQASPQAVKKAICGRKNASKDDVILEVERLYPEVQWPKRKPLWEHVADAIAVTVACKDSEVLRMARQLAIDAPRDLEDAMRKNEEAA